MMQPGTSALCTIVEQMTTDKALEGLGTFGGKVLKSSLSNQAQAELQKELHGRVVTKTNVGAPAGHASAGTVAEEEETC